MTPQSWQSLFGLEGMTAVVTDSGRNSSVEVATLLAEAGATVVLADREGLLHETAEQNRQLITLPTDVESEEQVIALFNRVVATLGCPDILVNCAAMNANSALTDLPLDVWDEVQSVNLRSVFLCMREALRHMTTTKRGGRIVNVTTMGARHPVLNGNAAYAASRSGVTGLTRSAALDYAAHGVLVNEVLPGAIPEKVRFHTMTQAALQAGKNLSGPGVDSERRLPLGYGKAEDVAAAVLYLVGPCGSYLTGQSLCLDGGFLVS